MLKWTHSSNASSENSIGHSENAYVLCWVQWECDQVACFFLQEITRYFLGYNEANQFLHPTVPLVTLVTLLDDSELDFGANFTVAGYLPEEYQVSMKFPFVFVRAQLQMPTH